MGHLFRCVSLFSYQVLHKSSMDHLLRCGSSILLLSVLTQVLCGSLVSVWIICSLLLLSGLTQVLYGWVACFGVDHIVFFYQVSHRPSMGRLFRCGSSILLLSCLTQVLYGSLVLFSMCTCACVCVCMCIERLCREITPPATLLQWEVKVIFVFARIPLTRL
jgi:hypothetical protein